MKIQPQIRQKIKVGSYLPWGTRKQQGGKGNGGDDWEERELGGMGIGRNGN